MKNNGDFYIYNLDEALFFCQQGCVPVEIRKARTDVFLRFIRNEKSEKVFEMWTNRSREEI